MNKNRNTALAEMNYLLTTYCNGCLLYKHFKNDFGRTYAHKFCITSCTVGQNLKKVGKQL